jgi:hypothetical protein
MVRCLQTGLNFEDPYTSTYCIMLPIDSGTFNCGTTRPAAGLRHSLPEPTSC